MTPLNKRKSARKTQRRRPTTLNLIALMDIFTILVFFLMVNQSDVEVIPTQTLVKLPSSVSDAKPRQQYILMVSSNQILLQGKVITTVAAIQNSVDESIPELSTQIKALIAQKENKLTSITILGDKEIPYQVLKKIIASCAKADITNIALATNQTSALGQAS